jgi:hypothetical protein
MARYPRYTTFRPEELQEQMKALCPEGSHTLSMQQVFPGTPRIKCHTFSVTFPDGKEGTCHYDRRASRWHIYRYQYADGVWMPYQSWNQTLAGDAHVIEAKGRELAAACYKEAIYKERKDYFQRATEASDGSRKKCPEKYRMKPAEAKAQAGKYAVCERLGESLYPISPLFDAIERANAAWREKNDSALVVACCNRLDRCFTLPRYNPLYAEHDPRPTLAAALDTPSKDTA